jgi:mannosylglycerate hydrolase MGH1-like protein
MGADPRGYWWHGELLNRRDFIAMLTAASAALKNPLSLAQGVSETRRDPSSLGHTDHAAIGFPRSDYTPFGYLDNPWHSWNLHQSGVLRSLPGIGFGLYYPAGPGGYFDYARNGIYVAELALGFRIGERTFQSPENFQPKQLTSPYHSKNILTFGFEEGDISVEVSFSQVNEDALAAHIEIKSSADEARPVEILARHTYRLGGSQWWGGDGLAGGYEDETDTLWIRSFAAGTVCALTSSLQSNRSLFSKHEEDCLTWLDEEPKSSEKLSYDQNPLHGGLRYKVTVAPRSHTDFIVLMARGPNLQSTIRRVHDSLKDAKSALDRKTAEDVAFWKDAPRLAGDWPRSWQHGWVYDFETLRTMVRRPIGIYKHGWDGMQIQAPRSVLAESSIDMWALSYANPGLAKQVFLGQFLDALGDNVPCTREDGVMNMVATDGSECGTSISWCFPFFCAASIFDRTHDIAWLRKLYPGLAALLRWTLVHRVDSDKFIVGKCSWETGMDTSKRFQIQQPTGAELVEFLRLVELQAAASHAGGVLARFAKLLGENGDVTEWSRVESTYAEKTRQLWKDDWFHDFDTRTMHLVETGQRDPSQAAPAFCGIASESQKRLIGNTLQKMYDEMQAQQLQQKSSADNALDWSSFVLPYLESAWACGQRELSSATVESICERIYTSMDRRSIEKTEAKGIKHPRLGWPGTSCEIWGPHGAFGGEVYGWGAVMPAHIVRNIVGFRETPLANRFALAPGFGSKLAGVGKRYRLEGLRYASHVVDLDFLFSDEHRLLISLTVSGGSPIVSVSDASGTPLKIKREGVAWQFEAKNFAVYTLELGSLRPQMAG